MIRKKGGGGGEKLTREGGYKGCGKRRKELGA